MPALAFGLLAHAQADCVAELLESLNLYSPGSRVLLFNGGYDEGLGDRLGLETCRYSRPVRWGRGLHHFVLAVVRQMHEDHWEFDYLVTLDSDMLVIGEGLGERLADLMRDADYMAAFNRAAPRGSGWLWSERMYKQWRQWGPLLGPESLRICYNPGQVLSTEYARRLMAWPKLPQLCREFERSRLQVIEELVWPSLADALGLNGRSWPDVEASALHGLHTPSHISELRSRGVSLLHKVKMDLSAPERVYAGALRRGERPDPKALDAACGPEYLRRDLPTTWRPRITPRSRVKDGLLGIQSLWWAGAGTRKHGSDGSPGITSSQRVVSQ